MIVHGWHSIWLPRGKMGKFPCQCLLDDVLAEYNFNGFCKGLIAVEVEGPALLVSEDA